MPLDTSIPLSVRPYEAPSPIQSIGSLMQLRGMGADLALKQAEQRRADQQAEAERAIQTQKNRDLTDQNVIRAAEGDPATARLIGNGDFSSLAGKIQPSSLNAYKLAHQTLLDKKLTSDVNTLKLNNDKHEMIEQGILGLKGLNDPASIVSEYPAWVQRLRADNVIAGDNPLFPNAISHPAELDKMLATNSLFYGANQKALSQKKTEGDIAHVAAQADQATATAGKLRAETPGATAESDIKTLQAAAMRAANARDQSGIDAIIDPAKFGDLNKRVKAEIATLKSYGVPPDKWGEPISRAQQEIGTVERETNPGVIAARVKQAVDTETATSPIKIHQAVQTQMQLNAGSGAALASVPPHLVPAAVGEYAKSGKELSNALSQASEWQAMIDAAKGGNKVAYSFVPTTGALTINSASGTHRINISESKALGGAGSTLDNFERWLGGHLTGESIPPQILDQMGALPKLLKEKATGKHAQDVQVINQSYGSKFEPVKLGDSTAGASGTIRARDPQGKLHEAPAGTPLPAGWKVEN